MSQQRTFPHILLVLGLGAILLVGIANVFHMGMNMGSDGMVTHCPFGVGMSLCTMSPFEMITASQNMFVSLSAQNNINVLFSLFILTILSLLFFYQLASPPSVLVRNVFSRDRSIPRNSLKEFLWSGVLNTKVF